MSIKIATLAVILSGAIVGVGTLLGRARQRAQGDDRVPITAIVQTGPTKEALRTIYLAELLDLSEDRPTLTVDFDCRAGEAKLLASPVIKAAHIRIGEPGVLQIDYTSRKPVALLADYENTALDAEGYPFPLSPFFSPKTLPEIYLDLDEEVCFNQPLVGEKKELAFTLLKLVSGPIVSDLLNVCRIDVSSAFEKSYGKREIVLSVEDTLISSQDGKQVRFVFPRLLRLSTKNYSQDLGNYLKLRERLLDKEKRSLTFPEGDESTVSHRTKIIDFRTAQLAFIDEGDDRH